MFSIQARIIAALAAIVLIAGIAWKIHHDAYKKGAEDVRQEYAAAATKAALSALKTQERLQDAVQQVGQRHENAKRQIVINAASADRELDGLRSALTARDSSTTEAAPTACRIDAGRAERELLGLCAANFVGLAKEADRIEAKLTALQDYIKSIEESKAK